MPGRPYVRVATVNTISIYSGTGDPNGVVSATRGSIYSDDAAAGELWRNTDGASAWAVVGGGGGGGARATFVLRPAGVDDPTNGVFTTWAGVHAAASAAEGEKLISIEPPTPLTAVSIGPAAAYDMTGIVLQGQVQDYTVSPTILDIVDGVIFTNWAGNTPFCRLDFNGTVTPLFTVDTGGGGDPYTMRSGRNSLWRSRGTVEMVQVVNASTLTMFLDDYAEVGNLDAAGFETFGAPPALTNISFRCSSSVDIYANSVRGPLGNADVEIVGGQTFTSALGGTINPNQANLPGGAFSAISGTQTFTATNAGDWVAPPPSTVEEAVNRQAAVLFANFGAIP